MSFEKPSQPDSEESVIKSKKQSSVKQNLIRGTAAVAAAAVTATAVYKAHETFEQGNVIKQQKDDIEALQLEKLQLIASQYHKKVNNPDMPKGAQDVGHPSDDETRARAIELAMKHGVHITFEHNKYDLLSTINTIEYQTTLEGVPFDIHVSESAIPYFDDDYNQNEKASIRSYSSHNPTRTYKRTINN